jgi:hypothetical protein
MAEEQDQSILQRLINFPSRNMDNPPALSGQLEAMSREAVKDVRDTMFQVFFGSRDGPGEPGTPLVPTQMMVNQELGTGNVYGAMLDGYAPPPQQRDPGQGMER